MKAIKLLFALAVVGALAALAFLYSGIYPIGADVPHTKFVDWALETLRERSIAARLDDIAVPPLDDSQMLRAGGADYNEMCAACHLKPGQSESDMSIGLYPQPPNLTLAAEQHGDAAISAARRFWVIKHGIKASAMPAWGRTHDDARIWAMVAFLQKLPSLTPTQYQTLATRPGGESGHEPHGPETGAAESHGGATGLNTVAALTAPDVVDAFQSALKSGDVPAALGWLAADVLIYEGGGAERSREEYAAHHLQADMAFLKAAQVERLRRRSGDSGDTAWVTTESRIRGKSSSGREVDVRSTETALLRKTAEGWRIAHLHWSSQDHEPAGTSASPTDRIEPRLSP